MYKIISSLLAAGGLLISSQNASASFHTFDISEIFSNSDGSIQFVELQEHNGSNNQDNFSGTGRGIQMDDGTPESFIFGTNLPSNQTANKFVLLATSGFEALAGITPDYIIPDNFLNVNGGTLGFGSVGNGFTTNTLTFASLPTDGITSLFEGGGTGLNTPTNFNGDVGSISAVPVPAAVWLFGSGLIGLVGVARRKK